MNREYVIQLGLAVTASFLLGFMAIQYALDRVTRVGFDEPVLYSDAGSLELNNESAIYAINDIDKELYVKHLTTITDPFAGCGCPSCCAARPS
jgi:hypothetical protein